MNLSQMNLGQRIARSIREFEQRRTDHGREWVAVFLNEETVVIAAHGCLTAAEIALAGTPAECARVSEPLRRLFADPALLQKIERICGMSVLDTTVEMEPATGGVVLLFTTDKAGMDFPLYPGRPSKTRTPRLGLLQRSEGGSRCTKSTGYFIRV